MAYTKPELRERIKNRVMASSKGGKPGQWSARKAQIVVKEFLKILSKSLVDCKTASLNKSAVGIFSANSISLFCWSRIFFWLS